MSGRPGGPTAAWATHGYFAKQRNRRGRQLGRVVASLADEIVVDRRCPGPPPLNTAWQPVVTAAEQPLALDEAHRQRTILRLDAGGGRRAAVPWAGRRGAAGPCKAYSRQRAEALAARGALWVDDPHPPGRQGGWVTVPPTEYVRPVQRIAGRGRKQKGAWAVGVLSSALAPRHVSRLTRHPMDHGTDPHAVVLAYVSCYAQRGGGGATANTGDTQGVGLAQRKKPRFAAQHMVLLVGPLAHHVLGWARRWLAPPHPHLARYGILRLGRDRFQISGCGVVSGSGQMGELVVKQAAPLAAGLVIALRVRRAPEGGALRLGET